MLHRLDIDLPVTGEYALEVYANDPARDGNTYTHVCQYLLVKPKKGDNSAALFYQTPSYQDCYNVHGMQEPLQPATMHLEELARGMTECLWFEGCRYNGPMPRSQYEAININYMLVKGLASTFLNTHTIDGQNLTESQIKSVQIVVLLAVLYWLMQLSALRFSTESTKFNGPFKSEVIGSLGMTPLITDIGKRSEAKIC